jgi:hypothetical protein
MQKPIFKVDERGAMEESWGTGPLPVLFSRESLELVTSRNEA